MATLVLVSVICRFYASGLLAHCPTPNLEGQGITLCLVSTLRPVQHGWPYQEYNTPADIALALAHNPEKKRSLGRILVFFQLFTMSFSFRQSCDQLPRHRHVRFLHHQVQISNPPSPAKISLHDRKSNYKLLFPD